jgi:hypothetical protein
VHGIFLYISLLAFFVYGSVFCSTITVSICVELDRLTVVSCFRASLAKSVIASLKYTLFITLSTQDKYTQMVIN